MTVRAAILAGLLFALTAFASPTAAASKTCHGRFPNPWSDVCWSCLYPITLGNTKVFKAKGLKPDTSNPSSPICLCGTPIPRIGLAWGFWEPVRLVDVSNEAYCFANLGGMKLDIGIGAASKAQRNSDSGAARSGYHVHWYVYPVMAWLEFLTDFLCVERASFDLAYLTELDPLWQDDHVAALIAPESVLFANPIAQSACAVDCGAASAGSVRRELFWCAGCQGPMYPMNGNVPGEINDIQGGLLAAERFAFKMHRQLLADQTSGPKAVCAKKKAPIIDKRQYRFQMVNPVRHTKGSFTCPAIGMSTLTYETGKTIPVVGEDYGYLVWRKRNCCIF